MGGWLRLAKSVLTPLAAAVLGLTLGPGPALATPHDWATILQQNQASLHERAELIDEFRALSAAPDADLGPARVEGVDYYIQELVLDENWEQWMVFQSSSLTIIPVASAKFYIYADAALEKLKRLGVLVITERSKSKPKQVQPREATKGLKDIGLASVDQQQEKQTGWNVLNWFTDPNADASAGAEREWDLWLVLQKLVFATALVMGCLVFVEILRMLFGVGMRAIANTQRRKKQRGLRR